MDELWRVRLGVVFCAVEVDDDDDAPAVIFEEEEDDASVVAGVFSVVAVSLSLFLVS